MTNDTTIVSANKTPGHWSTVGIFWLLMIAAVTFAQSVLIPIVMAFLITLIFSPFRRSLMKLGVPSSVSGSIIVLAITAILGWTAFALAGTVQTRLMEAPQILPDAVEKLKGFSGAIAPVMEASEQISVIAADEKTAQVVTLEKPGIISLMAKTTPIIFGQFVLCMALTSFLVSSGDLFYEKLIQIIPKLKDKARALGVARNIERNLSSYFLSVTVVNALLGLLVGVSMWMIGMPDPVLFGIAAFVLNFIPFFGAALGVVVTALVAVITFDTLPAILLPPVIYFTLTFVEGQFVTPTVVGRRLKLNTVVVFLSVAVGAWLWSFMGMFLSIPILIMIKAIADEVDSLSSLGVFLGGRGDQNSTHEKLMDAKLERDG